MGARSRGSQPLAHKTPIDAPIQDKQKRPIRQRRARRRQTRLLTKALLLAVAGFAAGLGVTTALTFTLPGPNGGGPQATASPAMGAMTANQFGEQRVALTPPPAVSAEPATPPPNTPANVETTTPAVTIKIPPAPMAAAAPERAPAHNEGPAMPAVKQPVIVTANLARPAPVVAPIAPVAKAEEKAIASPPVFGPDIAIDMAEAERREQIEHENVRLANLTAPPVLPPAPPPLPPAPTVANTNADVSDASLAAPRPTWKRFAALSPSISDANPPPVKVAIVLDDMGLSQFRSDRAIALPRPITLAVLPYGNHLSGLVARARTAGHEILVHLPMEPKAADADPGPNALLTGLPVAELDRRIAANLERLDGYVGINNHMGSLFTASAREMRRVMAALQSRQLLFLDSLTTGKSTGHRLAREYGIPTVVRDVFLDNDRDPEKIRRQLELTVKTARRHGQAIAIGHPYPETLSALESWLPSLRARGLVLVPISALVKESVPGQSG